MTSQRLRAQIDQNFLSKTGDYIEICNLKVTQIYMSDPAACKYIVVLTEDRIYLYNFPIWNENSDI